MKEIDAKIENLKKILVNDENFYQIPDFQRPYSWDKDNISDLIDDLTTAYCANMNDTYFCGSLVLVENEEDERFDIIDGQQRTTTFTIMSCVFRDVYLDLLDSKSKDYVHNSIQDKYEDTKRKLKFLTGDQYQNDFEQTVLKKVKFETVKNIETSYRDNNYLKNAHYIKEFLHEKISENKIQINEFVQWFYEKVVLTVITCPSQDTAIQIFNVLNDRGMPLSSIDILKAALMQNLSTKEDRKAFKAQWEDINRRLSIESLDINNMLSTYLYFKRPINSRSRLDKELIRIFQEEKKDSLEIIQEISSFSHEYASTLTDINKNTFCLKYLNHKLYWSSILSAAVFLKYPDIDKLKELLVAYYYQNWIAGATVARIKQTSFNILKKVLDKESIIEIKREMKKNLDNYDTTKTFKEAIEGKQIYGRKWDRAILLLIEYFWNDDSKVQFIPIESKLHLEHILPQSPKDDWKNIFTSEQLERWTNSLANLTLLSMRKNIQAQNDQFLTKKEIYQNRDEVTSSFLITQDVLKYDRWEVEQLEERKVRLLNTVMKRLDIFEE